MLPAPLLSCVYFIVVATALAVGDICPSQGEILNDWTGVIASPGWPNYSYPPGTYCVWRIRVPSALKLYLTLTSFSLETMVNESSCSDYLKICTSDLVVFYGCGELAEESRWNLSVQEIDVYFSADHKGSDRGFKLTYEAECSGLIERSTILLTPNYPKPSPANIVCFWNIIPGGVFNDIELLPLGGDKGKLPSCYASPIKVFEKDTSPDSMFDTLCDGFSNRIFRKSAQAIYDAGTVHHWVGKLRVRLIHSEQAPCSFTLHGKPVVLSNWSGSFQSAEEELPISRSLQKCSWVISVKQATSIRITLHVLNLAPSEVCKHFFRISDDRGQLLKSCGTLPPGETQTFYSNRIFIEYLSTPPGRLEATYSGECVQTIVRDSLLTVMNFLQPFPYNVACSWSLGRPELITLIKFLGHSDEERGDYQQACSDSPFTIIVESQSEITEKLCGISQIRGFDTNVTLLYNTSRADIDYWEGYIQVIFAENFKTFHCGEICQMRNCSAQVQQPNSHSLRCMCSDEQRNHSNTRDTDFCSYEIFQEEESHELFCPEETDEFGVLWPLSRAGDTVIQVCPHDEKVNASRICYQSNYSSNYVYWSPVNESMCMPSELTDLLAGLQTHSRHDTGDILLSLEKTARLSSQMTPSLDLNTLNDVYTTTFDILGNLSEFVQEIDHLDSPEKTAIMKTAIDTLDNLLHSSVIDFYEQKTENLIVMDHLICKVVEVTERFVASTLNKSTSEHIYIGMQTENINVTVRSWVKNYTFSNNDHSFEIKFADNMQHDRYMPLVYIASFPNSAAHFSLLGNSNLTATKYTVISNMVSIQIIDSEISSESLFKKHALLTFHLSDLKSHKNQLIWCAFLNLKASLYVNRWSSGGCYTTLYNHTHISCYCYHMSSFAILMEIREQTLDEASKHRFAWFVLSIVGNALSGVSCMSLIFCIRLSKDRSDGLLIHEQLAVSITFVQIFYLLLTKYNYEGETQGWLCMAISACLHYFIMSLFCWMLIEGVHLFIFLKFVYNVRSYFYFYAVYAWGVPLIGLSITGGIYRGDYVQIQVCWISTKVIKYSLMPMLTITVSLNLIILVLVIRIVSKVSGFHPPTLTDKSAIVLAIKASIFLLPLLGFTWTLGFILNYIAQNSALYDIVGYTFIVVNSSQGLFIFIFHALLNRKLTEALRRRFSSTYRVSEFAPDNVMDARLSNMHKRNKVEG